MSGGRLVPDTFVDYLGAMLGFGEIGPDGRYYAHDLSSVPIGWAKSGPSADLVTVRKQSGFSVLSRELLEDRGGRRLTWADRERGLVEHNRLRNRIRRIPAWLRRRSWAVRARIARAIYPHRWDEE